MTTPKADFATTTVFTIPDIADGTAGVMFAYRQPGTGLWYLLAAPGPGEAIAETMVAMDVLLARDPSLAQLAAMPPGRGARREAPGAAWSVFTVAPLGVEAAARAEAQAEVEAADERADAIEHRRLRVANTAGACAALGGSFILVVGGFILLTSSGTASFAGFGAKYALGLPTIALGLWIMVCGIVAGTRPRALPIVLAALPIAALAVLPLVRPADAGPLVELVTSAWPDALSTDLRLILQQKWHEVSGDQALLAILALGLLWRAALIAILGRRPAAREASRG